jgi:LPXTG-motif cell wall-anchored protein
MKTALNATIAVLAAAFVGAPALALEEDQVRGEIVEVMPDRDQLRLRVEEVGDGDLAREDVVETYELDQQTEIRLEDPRETLVDPILMELEDLAEGMNVVLDFEEDVTGARLARGVAVSPQDDQQTADRRAADAAADADGGTGGTEAAQFETRRELPATASPLPLLGLGGLMFAGAALALRRRRRR